jgi:puromycin-sensitive aminopeptidase
VTDSEARYRLPRSVTPVHYDLDIAPDLDAASFRGSEAVRVTVHEPVTEIVVNAKELEVAGGRLDGAGGATIEIAKVVPDAEAERVTLELAEEAASGPWTLHLTFSGTLNDKLVGFYRSVFTDDDGVERTIATTHFEATDARMCFPCWDEPDLKASFGVTLEVADGLLALSNGPEIGRVPAGEGRVRVRFADTMVMSTYLVCMVVGPLVVTEARDARGTPVRVVCRPGREHLAAFALEVAVFSLEWFGDYYAIAYPDAKLDNAAIPDFAQGAMENLGLVTYRETLLLLDPSQASLEERVDVAETVAHELAHMWFGDLVTMRWWNGIWLNEAFATFMSYLCVDAMRPEWHVFDVFTRIRSNAFEVDALESTRTIEYPVHSPDDASGMFDVLTYTKGGACLRMLEQWLGPDVFRDGIRAYLAKHAHGNTETHDLWDALEEVSGEPVRRIMDAWIFQAGYPSITASLDGDVVRLTQRRFIPSQPGDATTWPIPLTVRQVVDGREHLDRVLVEADGAEVALIDPEAVVIPNHGAASFVRVGYDDALRARLADRLDVLTATERQCFVDDAWAMVLAGEATASSFVDLVLGFGHEDDIGVWQAILTGLGWCDRFLEGEPRERFRDAVRGLVGPALGRLGWERRADDSDLSAELRGELVRALGILGDDPEAQAQAREMERDGTADGDVAAAAVDVVAFAGAAEDYERFFALGKDAPTPQAQERYRTALARFRDPALMDRTLEATLTDEIRPQDAPFLLARAMTNRDLGSRAFAFVAEHWDALTSRFAASNHIAFPAGARVLTAPEDVEAVQAFFTEHDIPQSGMMLRQSLERQRNYGALRQRATDDLIARFS